jgi:DNA-binding transcriptional MerR regulator
VVSRSRALGGKHIRALKDSHPRKRTPPPAAESTAAERSLKIGQAAELVGVEPYVLRFWETQFSFIRPRQSRSRHRHYTQRDVETLKFVKHLLHTEGYTIAGARRFVRENGLAGVQLQVQPGALGRKGKERPLADSAASSRETWTSPTNNGIHRALREIREDLRALHKLLATR